MSVFVGLGLTNAGVGMLWNNSNFTVEALIMMLQDSCLLFSILTSRAKWILDNCQALSDAEKNLAAEGFQDYVENSAALVEIYKELGKEGVLSRYIPQISPLPAEKSDLLLKYLQVGQHQEGLDAIGDMKQHLDTREKNGFLDMNVDDIQVADISSILNREESLSLVEEKREGVSSGGGGGCGGGVTNGQEGSVGGSQDINSSLSESKQISQVFFFFLCYIYIYIYIYICV